MKNTSTTPKVVIAAAGICLALVVAGGVAAAASDAPVDDDATDRAIEGTALDQASVAALDHTGQGTVTETEVGDEESLYEVEVTLDDGSQIDVQLDDAFQVVGEKAEAGGENADEG